MTIMIIDSINNKIIKNILKRHKVKGEKGKLHYYQGRLYVTNGRQALEMQKDSFNANFEIKGGQYEIIAIDRAKTYAEYHVRETDQETMAFDRVFYPLNKSDCICDVDLHDNKSVSNLMLTLYRKIKIGVSLDYLVDLVGCELMSIYGLAQNKPIQCKLDNGSRYLAMPFEVDEY